jgi:hypothetical protein
MHGDEDSEIGDQDDHCAVPFEVRVRIGGWVWEIPVSVTTAG